MKKTILGINMQLLAGALLSLGFIPTQANALTSPLDLTAVNSSGYVTSNLTAGGTATAFFTTQDPVQPAGTGVIQSFLQVQQHGNATSEQGINGTWTQPPGPAMDEGSTANFNHPLQLSDIPIVTYNGVTYREFLLDLNESNNDNNNSDAPYISLDQIKIYLSGDGQLDGNLYNQATGQFNGLDPIYDLQSANPQNWIELYDHNHGSGQSDMFALIPTTLFGAGNPYVYFYTQFGAQGGIWQDNDMSTNATFEEWAVRAPGGTPVPEPATMLLFGTGIAGLAGIARRKKS